MSLERRQRRKFERDQRKLIQKFHLENIKKFRGMSNEEILKEITKYNGPEVVTPTEITDEMYDELLKSKEE